MFTASYRPTPFHGTKNPHMGTLLTATAIMLSAAIMSTAFGDFRALGNWTLVLLVVYAIAGMVNRAFDSGTFRRGMTNKMLQLTKDVETLTIHVKMLQTDEAFQRKLKHDAIADVNGLTMWLQIYRNKYGKLPDDSIDVDRMRERLHIIPATFNDPPQKTPNPPTQGTP